MIKVNMTITHLKCHYNLPGANELTDLMRYSPTVYFLERSWCPYGFHDAVPTFIHVDSFSWWRHQMETFSPLLAICAPIMPSL